MANITTTVGKHSLSIKAQTFATLSAIVGAVALPQILHILGGAMGLGIIPGQVFLPMHLPIILVGLMAGPFSGAVSGLMAPIVSYFLTGMPVIGSLPFMMVELCAYGLFAGLLMKAKMPNVFKVLSVQILGRVFYTLAILVAVFAFGNNTMTAIGVWTGLARGILGIILQLICIPTIIYGVDKLSKGSR